MGDIFPPHESSSGSNCLHNMHLQHGISACTLYADRRVSMVFRLSLDLCANFAFLCLRCCGPVEHVYE